MVQKIYRLGIIGTGRIAYRFVPEARMVEDVQIVAVYNPRLSSAKKFAEELEIEVYTDNIEIFSEYVDAVYIATPHQTHMNYVKQMLKKGKHILCEKPMSFSGQEVMDAKKIAESNGLILMEAIKTAYCAGFLGLLELIKSGKIGQVVDVEACFTKLVSKDSRELSDIKYGGSFFELGSYVLLPIIKILGTQPKYIKYWSKWAENGVDIYTKIHLDYGDACATGKVGLGAKSEGELIITGTKGYIRVPAPWWLTKCVEVHYEDANATEYFEFPFEKDGLRYEIKAFVERMNGIDVNVGVTLEESAWIAELMGNFKRKDIESKEKR